MHANTVAAAYKNVSTSVLGARDIEQRVFQQSNGRLMAVRDNPDTPVTDLAEAIYQNTKIWTTLAVDVFSDNNTLPDTLRGQLASLAMFAQKTGGVVLRKEASVDILIDLNDAIIAGLGGDSGEQHAPRAV